MPTTPDGKNLYIRALKIDAVKKSLYMYAAEDYAKPAIGHVLVYSLLTGSVTQWYQGGEVLGESGGNSYSNIFSPDFKYLISGDSCEGFADMQMMRPGYFRTYSLE